jgi:glycosyltransferase involved in cell wall biosynthesis
MSKKTKKEPKIALAMIAKGDGTETEDLMRCLKYASPCVNGIFITLTDNGKGIDKETIEKCESWGAVVSKFDWVNHFAKARNFNFSQVPEEYDYILWLDSDDALRVNDKTPADIIKENPGVDCFSMWYQYSFDEHKNPIVSHHKTRIIRNDGCVEWAGKLHEDFKENRAIEHKHIEGIDVLHLQSDERIRITKERNLEIATQGVENKPDDPRSYWNLANSQKATGDNKGAIETFEKFIKMSFSDEEKYIAFLRMSEAYLAIKLEPEAVETAQRAIGLKPEYPDAYFNLGMIYVFTDQLRKAADAYLLGLLKPKPYYSIIVFNPRDYDYTPMKNLAKIYIALGRPDLACPMLEGCLKVIPKDEETKKILEMVKEAKIKFDEGIKIAKTLSKIKDKKELKKKYDKIPTELKLHPFICQVRNQKLIKETSSGKDIAFYCGNTAREWSPDSLKEGIGGSEEAIIHLSRLLSDKGWNVEVYNNCGHTEKKFGKVRFKPFWSFNCRDKQDVVVLWRTPRMAEHKINSDKIIIDLHDVIQPGEFNQKRLAQIDKVFVKSEFHKSLFPNVPEDKFVVVPNGIETDKFKPTDDIKRDPYLMINTSSPDRGINGLIDLFLEVKKQVPEVKLKWCYGWGVFDVVHSDNPKMMDWKKSVVEKMEKAGVENLGRINHEEIIKLHKEANILAYPTDFAEIDCIAVSKALAAGNIVVATDFSSIGEKADYGYWVKSDKNKDNWCPPGRFDFSVEDEEVKKQWVEQCIKALKQGMSDEDREKEIKLAKERFDWERVADVWNKNLC